MVHDKIIQAWKDPEYRANLTDEERDALPENPAGAIELTDDELDMVAGGHPPSYSQSNSYSNSRSRSQSRSQSRSYSASRSRSYSRSRSRSYSRSNSRSYSRTYRRHW